MFELLSKDSRKVTWKDFLYVQNNNLSMRAFWKFYLVFIIFRFSSKNDSDELQIILESCQNCILGVQRNHWCNWFPIIVFYSLPFGHWAKVFFRLLFEGVRPRCQNCVLCVQKEVLTKMFSKHCLFFISLGPCANFYWFFDTIVSAGLSKLNFTCPGEHFKGSLILWKSVIVFFVLQLWAKVSPMLSKLFSSCPEEISEDFFEKCYGFFFCGLWANVLGFQRAFLYRIVKTAFYVFRGPSWDKGFFK